MTGSKSPVALVAAITAGVMGAIGQPTQMRGEAAPPFGADIDVVFARKLWAAIHAADLIAATRSRRAGVASRAVVEGEVWVAKRVGRVIIKVDHGHSDPGQQARPAQDDLSPTTYSVMFKKPAGYDPDNKNWFGGGRGAGGRAGRNGAG